MSVSSPIAAPPAWVMAVEVDSGSWRCLVGLWTFADFGASGPTHVWPTREQLAERTGQGVNSVKKQLRKLADLGLVEPASRGWVLAWGVPTVPGPDTTGPKRCPQYPGTPGTSPDTTGPKPDTTGTSEGPTVPGPINLAGPSTTQQSPAAERASAYDEPTPAARHLALVAEQRQRLEAERAANREASAPSLAVTRDYVDVVRAAGAPWAMLLERAGSRWTQALGEAIGELGLTPAQVGEILAAWERACEAAGGVLAVEAQPRGSMTMPTRGALWWASWRPWIAAQLRPGAKAREAGSSRSASPLGCDAASGEVPYFGGSEGW